jgi:hypothetical protein
MNLIRGIMEEALEYPGKPLKNRGNGAFPTFPDVGQDLECFETL